MIFALYFLYNKKKLLYDLKELYFTELTNYFCFLEHTDPFLLNLTII